MNTGETYDIPCPACSKPFDAAAAESCSCLISVRTPACPACGACFCTLSPERQKAFWSAAPPSLWQRRLTRKKGEEGPGKMDLTRPLVLIAEDEPDTLKVAYALVKRLGYGVIPATNGQEALEFALQFRPDLVLTDAMMPKLDGRQLSLRLKRGETTGATKVAVMTGLFTRQQHKAEILRDFQADAYLKKPVNPKELQELLERLLGPATTG